MNLLCLSIIIKCIHYKYYCLFFVIEVLVVEFIAIWKKEWNQIRWRKQRKRWIGYQFPPYGCTRAPIYIPLPPERKTSMKNTWHMTKWLGDGMVPPHRLSVWISLFRKILSDSVRRLSLAWLWNLYCVWWNRYRAGLKLTSK